MQAAYRNAYRTSPMATRRILKSTVDSLFCPGGKDRDIIWDDKLKGFGVIVYPTGLKTYVAQYRKDGRSHRVVIGKHGRLTPDEARKEAKALLGDVEKGANPAFERRTKREAPTLDKLAEGFLAYAFAKKKSGTARGYDNALRLHILPQLGTKRLSKITHADVESLHASMSQRRPQANRTLAVLSAVWSWAARHRHVEFERGMIFLPDSKTGRKPIYLSAAAAAILSALPRIGGNPYVIPSEKTGQPRADLKRPWDAICEAAGLDGVRLHDLRHSFASVGAGASLGLPIIGKLLGHSQPSTTQRYAHLDADPMRRAVETIGSTIAAAMAGKRQ